MSEEQLSAAPADCVLVMAHPDDEALWASAVLQQARRIVLCFGDVPGQESLSAGRRAAMADWPLSGVEHLALPESGAFASAGWPLPKDTEAGVAVRRGAEAYAANFQRLLAALRERLRDAASVVTHNPWGEYGHEEHIQVFAAVAALQEELGFTVYVTGYCSNQTVLLMQRHLARLGPPTPPLPTDTERAVQLRDHYRRHGCWTWAADYQWPAYECFYPLRPEMAARAKPRGASVSAMNFIWLDAPLRVHLSLDPFAS
ncbi:MAG: hypothetical protein ACLFSI_05340 [Halorhodospira sp.]